MNVNCFNCGTPYRGVHPEARADYEAALDALERLRYGYQPMYNGRPSCPLCNNFVDDEETHKPDCLTVTVLRRLREGVPA